MAGFNSWGRTRSPKNLNTGGDRAAAVEVLANTNALKGITATSAGYDTENQRYLHVLVEDTNAHATPQAVTVFGYCHAFQRWFALPESEAGGLGQNTANADASISVTASSNNPADQTPDERDYRRYDIAGIDKVAFVNANADRVNVFAACSTF